MNLPFYVNQLLYVIIAILVYCIFYALNYAYGKVGYSKKEKTIALTAAAVLLAGWMSIIALAATRGHLANFTALPPRILLTIIPPALAVTYIAISERVNRLLEVIPKQWFVNIQAFRVLMEILLWLMYTNGAIPVQMTFEGRNFDIITGITAPIISYFCFTKRSWPKIVALLWNIAGLLLVTNIFMVALLSAPGPLRRFFNEPANTMVAYYPYVWIPAVIVPFAYLMHILSIKQLLKIDKD